MGQLLCILLLLCLLAAMLATELSRAGDAVSSERITTASYTYTDTLEGILLVDGVKVTGNNPGPVAYAVANGASVLADTIVARVYNDQTGTDKRERAAALYAEIERLEAMLAERESTWQAEYVTQYATLMQSLGNGELYDAAQGVESLSLVLARRDAASDEQIVALRAEIAQHEQALETLCRNEGEPDVVSAGAAGIFCRDVDGYEAVFGTDAARTLTPTLLTELLTTTPDTADAVGRVVDPTRWCVALSATEEAASTYREGECYTLRFSDGSTRATMTLLRIATEDERALLIFEGTDLPTALLHERAICVQVERDTVTGLRVPAAAIYDGNTVYVEQNGVARLRTIEPILSEHGCVLVAPSDDADALQSGDRVLISVRQIYDGKVFD